MKITIKCKSAEYDSFQCRTDEEELAEGLKAEGATSRE
jgi:hypothetical protein